MKPNAATLVRPVDQASGRVMSDEGTIESTSSSPISGAEYALVRNGRVIHYLMGRERMDLSEFVGQKVQITGTPVIGGGSSSVLEVSSVSVTSRG
jgi:hypothetical protein